MRQLNLPEFDIRLSATGEVFCPIRKKWLLLTPEEWVRQHFINLLITHLDYPRGLIRPEHSMNYFKNVKRSDIAVMDRNGDVFLLVECKSYDIHPNRKVIEQLSEYNKVLNAEHLAITNGMKHFVWKRKGISYETLTNLPVYNR